MLVPFVPAAMNVRCPALAPAERARVAEEQAKAAVNCAANLSYDDVIDPRELRNALLSGMMLAEGRDGLPKDGGIAGGILP